LKKLENDARVHIIALFFNWNIKDLGTMLYQCSIHYPVGKLVVFMMASLQVESIFKIGDRHTFQLKVHMTWNFLFS
jgi:hypothetical protein